MAKWRVAESLNDLKDEVNREAPLRAKGSDGTIGNLEHASRASRHNANDAGVVCARDITQDAANNADMHAYVRWLVKNPSKIPDDLEYMLSNDQNFARRNNWKPIVYKGKNPHRAHVHFAVGRGEDSEPRPPYDGPADWHYAEFIDSLRTKDDEDMAARFIEYSDEKKGSHVYCVEGRLGVHVTQKQTLDNNKANVEGPFDVRHADTLWLVDGPLANRVINATLNV